MKEDAIQTPFLFPADASRRKDEPTHVATVVTAMISNRSSILNRVSNTCNEPFFTQEHNIWTRRSTRKFVFMDWGSPQSSAQIDRFSETKDQTRHVVFLLIYFFYSRRRGGGANAGGMDDTIVSKGFDAPCFVLFFFRIVSCLVSS